jgi:hypothetical protein
MPKSLRLIKKKGKNYQQHMKQRDHFFKNILMTKDLTDFRENIFSRLAIFAKMEMFGRFLQKIDVDILVVTQLRLIL